MYFRTNENIYGSDYRSRIKKPIKDGKTGNIKSVEIEKINKFTMIKILRDTDLQSLEDNINEVIRGKRVKDIKIDLHYCKDYFEDGRICNQWIEYVGVIIFEN